MEKDPFGPSSLELALRLQIPKSTYFRWKREGMKERDGRGGKRHQKVKEEHINYMIDTIENDPLLTLKELTDNLYSKFNLTLSKTTVSLHLDLQLYTLKGVRKVRKINKTNKIKV